MQLLGRGGMGEVWQAYDLKLQVDVALKSVRAERFPGEQGLELLRREVRAAREVISPNVCRIFDLVEEEGQEFVSMEYIDGQTLLAILRERGPLELHEATRIASQFLAGLEAIHQAGLVHRDVKPENIMITRTGRVVLMDFGIAKGIADDQRADDRGDAGVHGAGAVAGGGAGRAGGHLRGGGGAGGDDRAGGDPGARDAPVDLAGGAADAGAAVREPVAGGAGAGGGGRARRSATPRRGSWRGRWRR